MSSAIKTYHSVLYKDSVFQLNGNCKLTYTIHRLKHKSVTQD
jgi:hypothetical protein